MVIKEHQNHNLIKKKKKKRKNTEANRNDSVPDLFPQASLNSLKSIDSQEGYERIVAIDEGSNIFYPGSTLSQDPITAQDRVGPIEDDAQTDSRPLTPTPQKQELKFKTVGIATLWEYLISEIMSTFQPEQQQAKTERILNFISVPRQLERFTLVQIIIGPAVVVYGTEIMVDWIKHAFIVKFNGISPTVYQRYTESLCRDLLGISSTELNKRHVNQVDRSPIVAKRIGFVSIPLACLVIRVVIQIMGIVGIMPETLMEETWDNSDSPDEMIGSWRLPDKLNQWIKNASLLVFKLLLGIILQNYAVKNLIDLKQEKEELPMESVLRAQTPNHFLPPEMFTVKRNLTSPTSNEKLDTIDRFTMVKSRIV
ncbi:hypothetical protein HDV01_002404 [Terramyces sp. JEL0728]|nr:hypothetical protein HDV01_002404 [Terramyces sp. JEL0728]